MAKASQARWIAVTIPANVAENRGRENSREFDRFLRTVHKARSMSRRLT